MKFTAAIDEFIGLRRAEGYINSDHTETAYRSILLLHGQDVGNRDPSKTGRTDVQTTLARWPHPNTRAQRRAILVSFYDWAMEEGVRETNPARMTRKPKQRKPTVYRMNRAECVMLLDATEGAREERVIGLGLLVGARNAEIRSFQREHFTRRAGAVWIVGKGQRQRMVPVLPELEPIVERILHDVGDDEYVIPGSQPRGGNRNPTDQIEIANRPTSAKTIWNIVDRVAIRAGIGAHIHPHCLRHAFGDHVTRAAGIRTAQAVLGHANLETTSETYTGEMTYDEIAVSLGAFTYGAPIPVQTTPTAQ